MAGLGGLAALLALTIPGWAGAVPEPAARQTLDTVGMFTLAERAVASNDPALAEKALRALTQNPDVRVRSEARFRLGRLLATRDLVTEAALLFRAILDEQPDAQPVRLYLAQMLERLGDEAGVRRALRQAQAGGLPPEVARLVDRWSAALRARKPMGSSLEIAVAPDSNINRATDSSTLGTVIGDFTLDRDARQRSGTGLALRGQVYRRVRLADHANLLARATASADLYRASEFNNMVFGVSAGPELSLGSDRLTAEINGGWQRFGGRLYSRSVGISADYLKPLDRRSQLRTAAVASLIDNRFNPLEEGRSASLRVSYERALSESTGLAATLAGERRALRDPGYSTLAGQFSLTVYRELGPMTLVGSLGYGRLWADERLALYLQRRKDALARISLGAEFRQLALGGFAPVMRISIERNRSSIELYQMRRVRTEFGLTRAF